jgi:tetratricopeptide (TPR) repeat protein
MTSRSVWRVIVLLSPFLLPFPASSAQTQVSSLLDQARTREKSGEYAAAEQLYQQALAISRDDPEILKRLGIVEQTELKFDQSIEHFRRVLAHDPKYPQVNFFMGVSYFGKHDFSSAIQNFQHELTTEKPHSRCRYYLALALRSSGRIDEAIALLDKAVAENPNDADAYYELARLHTNASLQAIEKLKELDPDSFQLHALMGETYAGEKQYADAISEYKAALAKRPDAPGIHFSIGVAYWVQHEWESADPEFLRAFEENPDDPLTNLYLGDIAVHEQRFADACRYLRIAEKGQPNMAQVHLLLGECYRGQRDLEKARSELLAAIDADPVAAQPHYLLAQVYGELHNPEASAQELAQFDKLSKLEREKSSRVLGSSDEHR